MKTHRGRYVLSLVGLVALTLCGLGGLARAEEVVERKFGVGYKVGNGIGFEGGDLIYRAFPHVGFDLQIGYYGSKDSLPDGSPVTFTGVGFAPAVHAQLRPIGHTPYLSAGLAYMRLEASHEGQLATGSATGFFTNVGYEWRFASGLGILVGGGVGDIMSLHVQEGAAGATDSTNHVYFNVEGGVRYFF
jgi:hypothetical protein